MARPKKKSVNYFPHQCNHGKTMFIIEQRYGNDGYAFWFKLLEILGSTEGHFITCSNADEWEFLQAKTHLSEDMCCSMLDLLSRLGAIDSELWTEKVIWCQNFVDGITDVYKNRRVEIPIKPSFYRQKPHDAVVSTDRNPQSKVKESKVKKSKVQYCSNSDEFKLACELLDSILECKPDLKIPTNSTFEKWIKTCDLILRKDKRSLERTREIIDFVEQDVKFDDPKWDGWQNKIMSPTKLRSKWDKLDIAEKHSKQQKISSRVIEKNRDYRKGFDGMTFVGGDHETPNN